MGRLQIADTAVLLFMTFMHDRLAIIGDDCAILGAWVLLPGLGWSDVNAIGGWRA